MTNPFDKLLLDALSTNNQEKYNRAIDILRVEAKRVAEINIPEDIQGAVDYAMDKVEDWLANRKQVFNIVYPFSYAKKIVRYGVIDYVRKRKAGQLQEEKDDETALEHQVGSAILHRGNKLAGWEAEAITTQIDGLGFDPEKRKLIPWHVITPKRKESQLPIVKHPAGNELLLSLPELNGWGCGSKEARRKRLSDYSNLETLIESIRSDKEKTIVKRYLWKYRNTDIAREFNVGESYISNVTRKWIRDIWGWNQEQLRQARLSLLTHYLGEAFERYRDNIKKAEEEWGTDDFREAKEEWGTERDLPFAQLKIQSEAAEVLRQELINAPETKAYRDDINEAERLLLTVCSRCHNHWGI